MGDEMTVCSVCGTRLSPGMAESDCPACLLKRGLESNTLASEGMATGRPAWVPPTPAELALRFPGLEINELIGRGGMGAVYKARQTSLDRVVALKILPPEIGREADFTQRFAREAQAMAKLNHPHIVAIYDFGHADDLFYFLMEFVDGPSLRQILNTGGVSANEALAIVPQICEALQFAHDHGIVHRDIKPENILLNRKGQVKIADFGLAKLIGQMGEVPDERPGESVGANSGVEQRTVGADQAGECTAPGKILGTPRYMAPEQKAQSDSVDHRADIYSLGVVFYEMLTGELPGKQIIPPSQKIAIDVRLDEIVLRALEKQPEQRYQHASEIKTQVATVVAHGEQERRPSEVASENAPGHGTDNRRQEVPFEPETRPYPRHNHTAEQPLGIMIAIIAVHIVGLIVAIAALEQLLPALWLHFNTPYHRIPGTYLCQFVLEAARWSKGFGNQIWGIPLVGIFMADLAICMFLRRTGKKMFLYYWSAAFFLACLPVVVIVTLPAILQYLPTHLRALPQGKSAYNPFIATEMSFLPQVGAVKLRYITPCFGQGGTRTFPVWNAKGKLVNRTGIRRFIFNKAVGDVEYLTGNGPALFLVFSYPVALAKSSFWFAYGGGHSRHRSFTDLGSSGKDKAFSGYFWFYVAIAKNHDAQLPHSADIPIRVAYGKWRTGKTRFPGPLANGAIDTNHLNIVGFASSPAGASFADVVWQDSYFHKTQRVLAAYTVYGKRLIPVIVGSSHNVGSGTWPQRLKYGVPLSQIKYFRVLSRPIHTIAFHNVALEPNPPGTGPAATVANTDQPAVTAARGWLAMIDRGQYSTAWAAASKFFRHSVSDAKWIRLMNAFRKPLGNLLGRKLKSATQVTTLPGAPDGQYVVMQFNSSFAKKKTRLKRSRLFWRKMEVGRLRGIL